MPPGGGAASSPRACPTRPSGRSTSGLTTCWTASTRRWTRGSSPRFDFEPFVCRDDDPGPESGRPARDPKGRKGKKGQADEPEPLEEEAVPFRPIPKPVKARKAVEALLTVAIEPDEARHRLGELEAEFLGLATPLDAPERRADSCARWPA